jgi:dTDP-4-dehydrorhamnose 3,5-epimerase
MRFIETKLHGVFIIEPEFLEDDRGFFARTWCRHEFASHGLNTHLAQCSTSFNHKRGTLRGMHYQVELHAETKVVRCTMGGIYDVILDLRPDSLTFKQWLAVKLTAQNHRMVYIPEGLAHGFQTLEDNTEVFYQISAFYHPESARGVRWNDPAFAIDWVLPVTMVSPKDATYPLWGLGR